MKVEYNFTTSSTWNNSILLRYDLNKIIQIDKLYFYNDNSLLKCQHFFDFEITDLILNQVREYINKSYIIKFSYINDLLSLKLENWANKNNYSFNLTDTWEAPQLILKNYSIVDYLKNNNHAQIKRNYKYYENKKGKYKFLNSNDSNVLKMWNDVLKIDYNSWKQEENSDMKSLNREDLQYLPFLLENKEKTSLIVIYDSNNNPLAYSLMFKNNDNYWYAVKWGASSEGRKLYSGIFCLFYHLEYLYSLNEILKVDFWGRRNKTYEYLSNSFIKRCHIEISKVV